MTDRRRTPRYVLTTPLPGDASPMHDVTVEHCSNGRAVVISPSAHRTNDELVIHMTTKDGLRSRPATVMSSSPVSFAGVLRYRLELLVEEESQRCANEESDAPAD